MEVGAVILLDTHVLLWLLLEPRRLSASATAAIRKSLATGGIAVASITLWELAMMIALHREEEFKLHVRPALANGVSLDELRALTMQAAIYTGVPAANAAFRWLREVLGDAPQ